MRDRSGEALADGARPIGIAGVDRVPQLQEHHAGLLVGGWTVAPPRGTTNSSPRPEDDVAVVLELDAQLAVDDQEQLIGVLVLVPDEFPWTLTSLTSSSLTVATILGCQWSWKRPNC